MSRLFFSFFLIVSMLIAIPSKANTSEILIDGAQAILKGDGIGKQGGFIRNWNKIGSGAKWHINIAKAGTYYLYLFAAAPQEQGGTADITLDDELPIPWVVPFTASFTDFHIVRGIPLTLSAGKHTLTITAKSLRKNFLMDIKYGMLSTEDSPNVLEKWKKEQLSHLKNTLETEHTFATAILQTKILLKNSLIEEHKTAILSFLQNKFPHQLIWIEQDSGKTTHELLQNAQNFPNPQTLIAYILKNPRLASSASHFQEELHKLESSPTPSTKKLWELYEKIAWTRRHARLASVCKLAPKLIFAKHHVFASVSGIYLITETEGSHKNSALCSLDLRTEKQGTFATPEILFDASNGIVRDPDISFDGKRLLFAYRPTKEHFDSTYSQESCGIPRMNYQIYEMNLETKQVRSLTSTETYGSSFEPCYLPNDDILFSSARIVQHITCGWGDTSNLFIMNKDGKYARRIGFDQTNTAFPTVLNDGRVIFTRRDYNDRGQSSAHALFQMNPDGSNQTEFYGNQTGLPNSFHHARAIPNSSKIITIIGGYHTTQGGKLALMDTNKGTQKDQGIIEIPGYLKPVSGDGYDDYYGKQGIQYSNPYPLSEKEYIVSIAPNQHSEYALYYLNDQGERELLAHDSSTSCLQAIAKQVRPHPPKRASVLNYAKKNGIFYVQNVYYGEAAKGIIPKSIKKIRVIEMLYKNATIGTSKAEGPGGCWDTVMPSGNGLATFDSKSIIGDATVFEDGSAKFYAPARKPLYFQLLDKDNQVVQTMRSWATLMPDESFSCVGCHEDKNITPLEAGHKTIALTRKPETLQAFYGKPRPFSFPQEVQPIFNKHCISCHYSEGKGKKLILTQQPYIDDSMAKKRFYHSYYALTNARPENAHQPEEFGFYPGSAWGKRTKGTRHDDEPNRYISWYTRFELMHGYPPYRAGSIKSGLIKTLVKGHQNVVLSEEELDKLRAWIDLNIPFAGEYNESNLWNDKEKQLYKERCDERLRNEAIEQKNIQELIKDSTLAH